MSHMTASHTSLAAPTTTPRTRTRWAGVAASLVANAVVSVATMSRLEIWIPAVAVALLVIAGVGLVLLKSPEWRRFGQGVLIAVGVAVVLNVVQLLALGAAMGS